MQEMTPEQKIARIEKQMAMADAIIKAAMQITEDIKAAFPRKRIFQKIDRRPIKRHLKAAARFKPYVTAHFAAMDFKLQASMPLPIYPSGGVAIVGDGGVSKSEYMPGSGEISYTSPNLANMTEELKAFSRKPGPDNE